MTIIPPPIAPERAYSILTSWYCTYARDLPWRHKGTTPWGILVCEVMSQQTPVARIAPQWEEWMRRWPRPQDMATASPAQVLIAWDRLGYPRRALRLLECAQEITDRFGGHVPAQRADLLSLPGIGPYTADALLAFAFKHYSVVLDTNIRRVLARWHGCALPAPHQTKAELARATSYVPCDPAQAAAWNGALMEFGALICTASRPRCDQCPVRHECAWRHLGYPDDPYAAKRTTQKFSGTQREARGKIMAALRQPGVSSSQTDLLAHSKLSSERFYPALAALVAEGLVAVDSQERYSLPA